MLDRTQSLPRKVEHLPIKLSVQSHLAPDYDLLNQPLGFTRNSARKPILRNKRKKTKSGLAQESQENTTAQTQRSLPPIRVHTAALTYVQRH